MNQKTLRLGRLAALSAVVATVLVALSLGDASAATVKPDGCPTGKPLVADVSAVIKNALDNGADGHIWAQDNFTNSIKIWRLGGDAYCVKVHSVGTSTTFAGLSPEGTGTVRAGVTASFDGSFYQRIYGTFAPNYPTKGLIGDFDYQCQPDGNCAGSVPSIADAYFSTVRHVDWGAFEFTADAGACGTWHQTSSGDSGDIVC